MTAEIAILNKTAVALAADSAVTISAGQRDEKIYDSADKLFELSDKNPIGIMIYNGMSFLEVPLQSLIREFRHKGRRVQTIRAAAVDFLTFLDETARAAPKQVKDDGLRAIIVPLLDQIRSDTLKKFESQYANLTEGQWKALDTNASLSSLLTQTLEKQKSVLEARSIARFVGVPDGRAVAISNEVKVLIQEAVSATLPMATTEQAVVAAQVAHLAITKDLLSRGRTGVVIAGFGANELFPTLISFEIDGAICGHLKYVETNYVDIDRQGPRAKVLPFAQREMVERFLYGLDNFNQKKIVDFAAATIPSIRLEIFKTIEISDPAERATLEETIKAAEKAFLEGLNKHAFEKIQANSQADIENMVEFMPKPELAKMAEALVNLTSIKRRVSRGMETVGGPIDVAIISQSEGFVWVKRKHYFPPELNLRYAERVRLTAVKRQEEHDDRGPSKPRRAGKAGRGKPPTKGGEDNGVDGDAFRGGRDAAGNPRRIPGSEQDNG